MSLKIDPVVQKTVIVGLENGLHLVPCSRIAQAANRFSGTVHIAKDELRVDAKNIFDLMTLAAGLGTELTIEADGDGDAGLIDELVAMFESNFDDGSS